MHVQPKQHFRPIGKPEQIYRVATFEGEIQIRFSLLPLLKLPICLKYDFTILHRVVSRFLSRRFHPKSSRLFPFYFSNVTLRTDLLTFRVTGAVFKIASEMRQLPAYFDNPVYKWFIVIEIKICTRGEVCPSFHFISTPDLKNGFCVSFLNRSIQDLLYHGARTCFQSGFFGSFEAPWSERSWIEQSS